MNGSSYQTGTSTIRVSSACSWWCARSPSIVRTVSSRVDGGRTSGSNLTSSEALAGQMSTMPGSLRRRKLRGDGHDLEVRGQTHGLRDFNEQEFVSAPGVTGLRHGGFRTGHLCLHQIGDGFNELRVVADRANSGRSSSFFSTGMVVLTPSMRVSSRAASVAAMAASRVSVMDDELGQQGVVVRADRGACLHAGVHPDARRPRASPRP